MVEAGINAELDSFKQDYLHFIWPMPHIYNKYSNCFGTKLTTSDIKFGKGFIELSMSHIYGES